MPLTTRCRDCGRLFPVYAQQIKARGSKVECPQCGHAFNALSALLDEQIPPSEIGRGRRARAGRGRARVATPTPSVAEAPPVPSARRRGRGWSLGVLVLTAALIVQIGWWERGDWLGKTPLWAMLEQVCAGLGCSLPLPRLAGSMEIVQPSLAERPGEPNALQLRLALVNRADIAQRLPLLQLELYDDAGQLLAARRITPEQYGERRALQHGIGPAEAEEVTLDMAALDRLPSGFRVRLF